MESVSGNLNFQNRKHKNLNHELQNIKMKLKVNEKKEN